MRQEYTYPLLIAVEPQNYPGRGGHLIYLNEEQIAWRPFDGAYSGDVMTEFVGALGALVREKLGLEQEVPGTPMWYDSEDRDRGAPPDYYLTDDEDEDC